MRILICATEAPLPPVNGFRRMLTAVTSELIDRLAAGDLDVAIVADADRLPELPGEIVLEPLMDDPLHLAVPRDHPLATAKHVRMTEAGNASSGCGRRRRLSSVEDRTWSGARKASTRMSCSRRSSFVTAVSMRRNPFTGGSGASVAQMRIRIEGSGAGCQ